MISLKYFRLSVFAVDVSGVRGRAVFRAVACSKITNWYYYYFIGVTPQRPFCRIYTK